MIDIVKYRLLGHTEIRGKVNWIFLNILKIPLFPVGLHPQQLRHGAGRRDLPRRGEDAGSERPPGGVRTAAGGKLPHGGSAGAKVRIDEILKGKESALKSQKILKVQLTNL